MTPGRQFEPKRRPAASGDEDSLLAAEYYAALSLMLHYRADYFHHFPPLRFPRHHADGCLRFSRFVLWTCHATTY